MRCPPGAGLEEGHRGACGRRAGVGGRRLGGRFGGGVRLDELSVGWAGAGVPRREARRQHPVARRRSPVGKPRGAYPLRKAARADVESEDIAQGVPLPSPAAALSGPTLFSPRAGPGAQLCQDLAELQAPGRAEVGQTRGERGGDAGVLAGARSGAECQRSRAGKAVERSLLSVGAVRGGERRRRERETRRCGRRCRDRRASRRRSSGVFELSFPGFSVARGGLGGRQSKCARRRLGKFATNLFCAMQTLTERGASAPDSAKARPEAVKFA